MTKPLTAVGLMSGTSLDGIDAAAIRSDGEDVVEHVAAASLAYAPAERQLLGRALDDARSLHERQARPGCLAEAEAMITIRHAEAVQALLTRCGLARGVIDVIGFHGQTVLHRPGQHLTVQLGDGAELARLTGVTVVADMRAADVAAGGQGAPLAPVYHRALAAALTGRPLVFVNIGGVANVTWIGADGHMLAFDTGPGNALMDDWAMRHTGCPCDRDGKLAAAGVLDATAFRTLALSPYFEQPVPKSLDRNAFDVTCLEALSPADGAATLAHFTATSIARAAGWFPEPAVSWVICGGGRHNPTLMRNIRGLVEPLGQKVKTAEEAGIDGDIVEAEAWAYMAVRSLKGLALTWPSTTGVPAPMTGGVLHRP
jgi:anhydro-N-acetylmuramic acid kinase